MNNARTKLGNHLFALAKKIYPAGEDKNPLMKELGDMLFKLAAEVSPNKTKVAVKKPVVKAKKTAAPKVKKAVKKVNKLTPTKLKK